jgi:dephospho-CoA kinase
LWLSRGGRVLTVGLTGGIGSGKSEVSRRLAALGAVIVDSDAIAREVVEPGTEGLAQVVAEFGPEILADDGSLDREALAAVVFGDDDARQRLSKILHPLIGSRAIAAVAAAGERDPDAIVIQDIPLLVEAGLTPHYAVIVVVDTPADTQLERLTVLRGMTEADARARIATQATREQRLAAATHVIRNEGGLDSLDAQVRALWATLQTIRPRSG